MGKKTGPANKRVSTCRGCAGRGTIGIKKGNHTVWAPCKACGGKGIIIT